MPMPTSSTTDPMAPTPPSPAAPASPAVPTREEIARLKPDERQVFRGVDWGFYERLHEVVGVNRGLRIAFDGEDLEIMPTGRFHEGLSNLALRFIDVVSEELAIPAWHAGSTTWMRPEVQRGIEADQSFYFLAEKLQADAAARARRSNNVADYPNPDLAVEVDISTPQIDRVAIYAALKVTEVWRLPESTVIIDRLTDQGTYAPAETSVFLPVRREEIERWIFHEDSSDLLDWKRRLRAWVRAELVGRTR
jgi:Uma2 family endonuclease